MMQLKKLISVVLKSFQGNQRLFEHPLILGNLYSRGGGEVPKPDWPNIEAQMAESGGEVLGERTASPFPTR